MNFIYCISVYYKMDVLSLTISGIFFVYLLSELDIILPEILFSD